MLVTQPIMLLCSSATLVGGLGLICIDLSGGQHAGGPEGPGAHLACRAGSQSRFYPCLSIRSATGHVFLQPPCSNGPADIWSFLLQINQPWPSVGIAGSAGKTTLDGGPYIVSCCSTSTCALLVLWYHIRIPWRKAAASWLLSPQASLLLLLAMSTDP